MAGYYAPLKTDDADAFAAPAVRTTTSKRFALGLGLLASTVAFCAFYSGGGRLPVFEEPSAVLVDKLADCPSGLPPLATPPAPVNPWASLTVKESVAIYDWLWADARGLNLTQADTAQPSDNVLFHIEAFRPPKADALAYLAAPNTTILPQRYARITINHGAAAEPYIGDYLVGPLPVDAKTAMTPLTDIYHRDDIPFHARGFTNMAEISTLFMKLLQPLAGVTAVSITYRRFPPYIFLIMLVQDLFNATVTGQANDTLIAGMAGPWSFDGSFRRGWVSWRRNVPGPWIHPINFFQYVDVSGNDPNEFKLLKVCVSF
jgi:primary-amine oxidase